MALNKETKSEIIKKFGENEKDTGSIEVQVALVTERIKELTEHLKANHKDHVARRSLLVLVGKRKSLLRYLERTDRERYLKVLSELNLRK